jgi:predicted secreted protein
MQKSLFVFIFAALASCAVAGTKTLPDPAEDTCDANRYAHFLGEPKDMIDDRKGYYFQHPYNVIPAGETLDLTYRADDPLNRTDIIYIMLDGNEIIRSLTCIPPVK